MNSLFRRALFFLSVIFFLVITISPVSAHVKWFSGFSFADKPLTLEEALTPAFWSLALLSMVVIGLLVVLDRKLSETGWYRNLNDWLSGYRYRSVHVMRIAAGVVLLLSWQADAILVPELPVTASWIGWMQFLLAFLLIFKRTVPLAGLGLIALYLIGVNQFGLFHMLDYILYAGTGYYLAVQYFSNRYISESGIPALYSTVGFSLCWVALEKIIYPQWGLYVLQQQPQLALGFDLDFFLVGAAFVEFSLGYLLIICLLQRPLSVVITCVFFLTTLVFGKLEVIGHTLIHGALIVFLIEGPGKRYKAPVTFHKKLGLRAAFASVNFGFLLVLLLLSYTYGAWQKYEQYTASGGQTPQRVEVTDANIPAPQVGLSIHKDSLSGWNLRLAIEHFAFTPEELGTPHVPGEGHAHLYIDGRKVARINHEWHHLEDLPPGSHELVVTLNTNDHGVYTHNSSIISDTLRLVTE